MENLLTNTEKLHRALSLVCKNFDEAGVPWLVDSIGELIYQEMPMALDLICSNLNEFAAPIVREAYELIVQVGWDYMEGASAATLEFNASTWEVLKPLVVDE